MRLFDSVVRQNFNDLDIKNSSCDLETLEILPDEKGIGDDLLDCIYKNSENRYETKLPFKETYPISSDNL